MDPRLKNEERQLPTIQIQFDPENFTFGVALEMTEWKTWEMVIAALDAIKGHAQFQQNMQRAAAMQQNAQQMNAVHNLRRNLRL